MATRRAFILAGTGSGCGKTTVTLGLLSLLQQRGMRVQPCKVGPDYLDTAWHTAISGIASRNLDSFMLPARYSTRCLPNSYSRPTSRLSKG